MRLRSCDRRLGAHLVLFLSLCSSVRATSVNVSVSNTSPEIIYTPFLCDSAASLAADPGCEGAWNATQIGDIPTVSSTGPGVNGGNLVPQMFMSFRASALYMSTSVLSNAMANFTVSSGGITESRQVDTSAGLIAVVNLNEGNLSMMTVTFVPTPDNATRLDIGSIILTVTDPGATTSFLPTKSLPPSATVASSASAASASASSPGSRGLRHRAEIGEALGIVLSSGVGLSIIVSTLVYWWCQSRKRRSERTDTIPEWSS